MKDIYDFAIVGGGPAALSSAIYAARFRLKTIVLAREVGGTLINTHLIENWPGEKSISGAELMDNIRAHAEESGAEIKQTEVKGLKRREDSFLLQTDSGDYSTKTVLLATGSDHRKLGVPGEKEYYGKGVSYCAVCDAAFFKDKSVCVIGGSDSAAKEAIYLSKYAKKVYIIYRKEKIRAEPINRERVEKNEKIEVINNSNVTEVLGEQFVTGVRLDKDYNGKDVLALDGIFVEIGFIPNSYLAKEAGANVDDGGIRAGRNAETNVEGLFAAGDVTSGSFKQAITASAQGVLAANSAYQYLNGQSPKLK